MLATVGYARVRADNGERVNAINPGINCKGPVDQNLKAAIRSSGRNCDEVLAEPLAEIPKSRKAEPEKIDNVMVFLTLSRPSGVTGAIISDGRRRDVDAVNDARRIAGFPVSGYLRGVCRILVSRSAKPSAPSIHYGPAH